MAFKDVLQDYMKNRDSEEDITFMENLLTAHNEELNNANQNEQITKLEIDLENAKKEKEESERTWRQKYRDAFFKQDETNSGTEDPKSEEDVFELVKKNIKYLK